MTAESRVSSFKNVFHTLSYRFDAIISLRLYSCGKGKGMNDCVQGGIADTLTIGAAHEADICQSFNGVRYLGLHTTGKEGVGSSFYDGIASLARIVEGVTLFYHHAVHGFTPLEASRSNTLYGAGYADGFQFFATIEDIPFDRLQGVGEDNGRQGFATIEAIPLYLLQGVGKGDGGQTGTISEGTRFQRLDGVGNHDGGQTGATGECLISQHL